MSANAKFEHFRTEAAKYAAYLETPEGRLRLDLSFANLQEFLAHNPRPLNVLDLGGGTGVMAVRLARLGHQVTLLDSSLPMLDFAQRAAQEAGVTGRIAPKHGEVAQLADFFPARSFDAIVCHNLLEYLEDPVAALRLATRAMRDESAIMSIMVRNQSGEVLKAAIQAGDLSVAEQNLTAEWGLESLYGCKVRLFTTESLNAMLAQASLVVVAERGVRVVSDYLPPQICRATEYARIFELERKLGKRPEFAAVARYSQYLMRCVPGPVIEDRS